MGEVEGEVRSEQLDAEREARRRAALVQIRQYPDPVLRMKAKEVEALDEAVHALVERMTRLMTEARGVGLAAPQLGILRRIVVYQAAEEDPVRALVNPRLVASSEEQVADDEGCLSLGAASVVVEVERPAGITVEASTPAGESVRIEAEASRPASSSTSSTISMGSSRSTGRNSSIGARPSPSSGRSRPWVR
jgi:peptide deformylase